MRACTVNAQKRKLAEASAEPVVSSCPRTAAAAANSAVRSAATLNIVIRDKRDDTDMHFRVDPTRELGPTMASWASCKHLELKDVRFVYDGTRVQDDETPQSFEMETGDVVDAHIPQMGC